MKIHYLQHVHFEGLGSIEPVLKKKGHIISDTKFYDEEHRLPDPDDFDWLIVMGGPMGIFDYDKYSWLKAEKLFIRRAIDSGKLILGICLGAQLIADVLGASVYRNPQKEIGWFDISPSPAIKNTMLSDILPPKLKVFHWHSDTFDLPKGAINIASSEACQNQGFILDNRIFGLQFHLETTMQSAAALIENGRKELDVSKFVQTEEEMLADYSRFTIVNRVMNNVLNIIELNYNK